MGLAGVILKKRGNIDIQKIIQDVRKSTQEAGLATIIDSKLCESWGTGVYTTVNVANTFEDISDSKQWLMYLYSDDINYERFDRVVNSGNLVRIMNIESFSGCEDILLDFLYEYFKLNPEDYFWDELEWYYTYEDIVRIKQKEFDCNWCYKNPHLEKES